MKRILQNIIKYWYWKLSCHTTEPFAHQLIMYAIPGKIKEGHDIISIVYQLKQEIDRVSLSPIIANAEGKITEFETLILDGKEFE